MPGRHGLFFVAVATAALHSPTSLAEPDAARPVDPGEVYEPGHRPRPEGAVVASVQAEELARWNAGGASDPGLPSNRPGFHPAPRVHVSLDGAPLRLPDRARGKRGVLSRVAVLAQARNFGYWPFRVCFEEGLRRFAKLSGATAMRLSVARDGHVSKSTVIQTGLQQSDVSQCLTEKARRFRFSPAPSRPFSLRLIVDLHPGDAPLPDTVPVQPAEARQAEVESTPKLHAQSALEALGAARGRVAECYARAASGDPKLWGRLAILLDVDPKGRVTSAAQYESQFPAAGVVACAKEAVRGAQFSTAPGEGAGMRLVWALRLGAPATAAVSGTVPPETPAASNAELGSRDP